MKRIAIFCDGTWNKADATVPTHVVRIAQAVRPIARDKTAQIIQYHQGVGTGQGVTWINRKLDQWLGGALGWGLDDRIEEAYRALLFNYEPGDQVYIFGFSRGAYTARSLAGLIRTAGILPSDRTDLIPEAMALYRAREGERSKPDHPITLRERLRLSPDVATSPEDQEWRRKEGRDSHLLQLGYLGVWDTVGALGVPSFLGPVASFLNGRYRFHDAKLSRSVAAARHAVAIDERRRHFPAALWQNLDDLNGAPTGPLSPYQQLWFPGNHGIVGGSASVPELSAFPTAWIVAGAQERKLDFNAKRLAALLAPADLTVDDKGAARYPSWKNLWGKLLKSREMLLDPATNEPRSSRVSEVAKERVRKTDYRPRTLDPLLDEIID